MTTPPRPLVLLTTSTSFRDRGLRRQDALTGRNYSQALLAEGALPMMVANLDPAAAPAYLERADGLLLTGGVDVDPAAFDRPPHPRLGVVDPERDAFEFALYRGARDRGLPVLGICRGIQLINVAEGGTLHQHLPGRHDALQHDQADIAGRPHHRVRLTPSSLAATAAGATEVRVNSHHHQGVDDVAPTLVATGHSDDGLVEALEGRAGAWLLAVQWHPEMVYDTHVEARWPFRAFATALAERARARAADETGAREASAAGGGAW
jgi:putative glutamine amidotransferase